MEENVNKRSKKKQGILSYIIGGKFLRSKAFTDNGWLFALIVIYTFIYVSNRYAFQQELTEIDALKRVREDLRFDVLTLQSEFSEKSRQSRIEEYINKNESSLKTATHPPFLIE